MAGGFDAGSCLQLDSSFHSLFIVEKSAHSIAPKERNCCEPNADVKIRLQIDVNIKNRKHDDLRDERDNISDTNVDN